MTAADSFRDAEILTDSHKVQSDAWMIRPCEVYQDECNECTGLKGRFHQYYIHGTTLDCDGWKQDAKNCLEYRHTGSLLAAEKLVESEQARRKKRLIKAHNNNVWQYRTSPPDSWNAPLPEHLERTRIPELAINKCVIS